MNDGIRTDNQELWLERIECAMFEALHGAVCARDVGEAGQWVGLLERLSIV